MSPRGSGEVALITIGQVIITGVGRKRGVPQMEETAYQVCERGAPALALHHEDVEAAEDDEQSDLGRKQMSS